MINKIKYLFILIIIGFIIGLSRFSITTTTKKAESKHCNTNIEVSGYTDEVLMNEIFSRKF